MQPSRHFSRSEVSIVSGAHTARSNNIHKEGCYR